MTDERYILMIHKYLRRELTESEGRAFQQWLEQDPAHRQLLEETQKAWTLSSSFRADYTPDLESGLQALKARIAAEKPSSLRIAARNRSGARRFTYAIAAALLLLVSVLVVWNFWFRPAEMFTASTSSGEHQTILLSDGSSILLNQNSKITYPSFFRGERQVELSGEAYFEIERDPEHPFVITTLKTKTEVLGTSFNLRAYDNEGFTEIEVIEGLVRIGGIAGKQPVDLPKGSRGTYQHVQDTVLADKPKTLNSVYWKDRRLGFKDHELKEAIKEVNARLGINIQINNTSLASCSFTLAIPLSHPDTIVANIADAFSANWNRSEPGEYSITGGSCIQD